MASFGTVAITGATAGVGRAVARAFAETGAKVGLIGRSAPGLKGAAAEVEAAGGTPHTAQADVADPADLEAATRDIENALGPIDIWVNNAMATVIAPVWEQSADEIKRVTEVTYLGTVNGTLTALSRMRARGRGTIVQIGSALAYRSIPLQAPYCAAKSAGRAFTDSLRTELMHEKSPVRITMVHLPAVNTPQFDWAEAKTGKLPRPVAPVYQPEAVAKAVLFAAKARRREVWAAGSVPQAILGQRIAPGYLDKQMAKSAWSGQMREADDPDGRSINLWETPSEGHATRGSFSDEAKDKSRWFWLTRHQGGVIAALVGLLLGAFALMLYLTLGA